MKLAERVEKYFAPDSISINLINRAINEFSHLEEYVDRGLEPIDLNEIITISQFVLNKMNSSDPDQYNALLESVNDLIEE
jgi:hypothetical protein